MVAFHILEGLFWTHGWYPMQRMFLLALIPVILTACAGFQGGGGELVAPAPSRSALSLYAQARIALNEGDNERALALVREAQLADPKASHLLVAEAELRLKAGQVPEAMVAVEKAVTLDPENREAQLIGGTVMANLGRDREAISYLRAAVKLDPTKEDAVLQLVNSLLKLFEYEESVTALKELTRLKPDSAPGFYYLGKTYSQMRLYREAAGYYKRALEIRPDFIQAAIDQAVSLEAMGEIDQAISAYKVLIDDSENRSPLINHLIQLLIQHRRYDEALVYLNRLSDMGLGGEEVQRKIGLLLLELNRHDETIQLFNAMLAKDPNNHQIRFYLGSAYEEKGELELARTEFAKIPVDDELYGEALGHLAFILKEQERDDEAVKLLQQGITAYPNRLEIGRAHV